MKSTLPFGLLLSAGLMSVLSAHAQTLLNESFDDPIAAAQRFATVGSAQFTGHDVQRPANSAIFLNAANAIPGTDSSQIRYSIVQTFAPGNLVYPNLHESIFYVRVPEGSLTGGYGLMTLLSSGGPYIAVTRGNLTLLGGSMFAPPILSTLGPYEMTVTLWNSVDAVNIDVTVGNVHALTVRDTYPDRLTSGGSVGFGYYGTYSALVDNLAVTAVPEPSCIVLLLIGGFALALRRARAILVAPSYRESFGTN